MGLRVARNLLIMDSSDDLRFGGVGTRRFYGGLYREEIHSCGYTQRDQHCDIAADGDDGTIVKMLLPIKLFIALIETKN